MLCLCVYVIFNGPGDSKHLGSAGRQADEYIAPGGKFLFYVSNFAYERWKIEPSVTTCHNDY